MILRDFVDFPELTELAILDDEDKDNKKEPGLIDKAKQGVKDLGVAAADAVDSVLGVEAKAEETPVSPDLTARAEETKKKNPNVPEGFFVPSVEEIQNFPVEKLKGVVQLLQENEANITDPDDRAKAYGVVKFYMTLIQEG